MVDSAALRQRRKRAHRQGNHTSCRPEFCNLAGTIEAGDVRSLRDAIETELGEDLPRLELARSLITVAARGGPAAVGALRELSSLVEAKRRGELTPVYNGPVTVDDQILELVDVLERLALAGKLDELEAACAELGWPAAIAAARAEVATAREESLAIFARGAR
jgi:hypothetical protein